MKNSLITEPFCYLFVRYRNTELNYALEARLKRKSFSSVWITLLWWFCYFLSSKSQYKVFFFPKTFLLCWLVFFLVLQYTIFLSICKLCRNIFPFCVWIFNLFFTKVYAISSYAFVASLREDLQKKILYFPLYFIQVLYFLVISILECSNQPWHFKTIVV